MPLPQPLIDGETIAMPKKINDHGNIIEAEVVTIHGTFRLVYDEKLEDTRWDLDISDIVRLEDAA